MEALLSPFFTPFSSSEINQETITWGGETAEKPTMSDKVQGNPSLFTQPAVGQTSAAIPHSRKIAQRM